MLGCIGLLRAVEFEGDTLSWGGKIWCCSCSVRGAGSADITLNLALLAGFLNIPAIASSSTLRFVLFAGSKSPIDLARGVKKRAETVFGPGGGGGGSSNWSGLTSGAACSTSERVRRYGSFSLLSAFSICSSFSISFSSSFSVTFGSADDL